MIGRARNDVRVLQLSSAKTFAGGERHFVDLTSALADRGHEVYAVVRPRSPLRERLAALPAPHVFDVPLRNSLDVASGLELRRLVRELQIEIMHAHVARDYTLAAFASAGSKTARLVLTRHLLLPLKRIHAVTLRRSAARVIAVSEAVGRSLRAQKIFPDERICVVPNGVRLDHFGRRRPRAPGGSAAARELAVGIAGELREHKGVEEFLRAAALVARREKGARFVVAGEDPTPAKSYRTRIERLIRELGLAGRVRLMGQLEDLAPFYSSLDVFVSASRVEPFGLVMIEAMACGVPVVATATDGAREIVGDGVTGRLVPVGDFEAIAAAVCALLEDEDVRAEMGERARERAREQFSLERMVDATEAIYREALTERAARG